VRILGIVCRTDGCDWALIGGQSLAEAALVEQERLTMPADRWHKQLSWVRQEASGLLRRLSPDLVAVRVAQGGPKSGPSPERLQIEAAVFTAIADAEADLVTFHSATASKATKPYGGEDSFAEATPHMQGVPKSRRGPSLVATYALMGFGMRK
jgi:hypothetical protein